MLPIDVTVPAPGAGMVRTRNLAAWARRLMAGVGCSFAVLAVAGCGTVSQEPRNLDLLKAEIRAYVKSGDYDREIAAVAARTIRWIEQRTARRRPGERVAVVFDLDETLLSNQPELVTDDFGGGDAAWDAWMATAKAGPIEPIREVYSYARQQRVDVVYITSRHEHLRAATEANLRAIGCADYLALIMKPDGAKGTAADFKTDARRRIASEGYSIIANIGDQESDLTGGLAERVFKLPDPFYLTP